MDLTSPEEIIQLFFSTEGPPRTNHDPSMRVPEQQMPCECRRAIEKKTQLQQNSSVQSCKVTEKMGDRDEDVASAGLSQQDQSVQGLHHTLTNQGLGHPCSRQTKHLPAQTNHDCRLLPAKRRDLKNTGQTSKCSQAQAVPMSQE